MPHIDLPEGLPGILSLFAFRPETGRALQELADALLRGPSPLSPGERELIAAFVSSRNSCDFCCGSHSAFAAAQLPGGAALVQEVLEQGAATAPVDDKMRALLAIAEQVQRSGRDVTEQAVAAAKGAGATDVEIHDTVLIAAAFCMFNRYVDGLGTVVPDDPAAYGAMAPRILSEGYAGRRLAGTSSS